jgi:chromate transporter
MKVKNIYLDLFLTFFKIGLFTFGGGYAMLSLIDDTCVENKKWITNEEMVNVTTIAESTPGPIAINCSTFVGYKQGKLLGAICATLGVILPSFIIILGLSYVLNQFLANEYVAKAFKGIQVAVGVLIVNAGIKMFKKMKKDVVSYIFLILGLAAMLIIDLLAVNFSSIYLLIIAGALGFIVYSLINLKSHKKEGEDK